MDIVIKTDVDKVHVSFLSLSVSGVPIGLYDCDEHTHISKYSVYLIHICCNICEGSLCFLPQRSGFRSLSQVVGEISA